jgi:hypothetical protein
MSKAPTPESIADGLTATERCVRSGTDWRKVVGVGTAQHMLIRGLIERAGSDFSLTDQGRAVGEGADDAGGDAGHALTPRYRRVCFRGLTVRPGRGILTVKNDPQWTSTAASPTGKSCAGPAILTADS